MVFRCSALPTVVGVALPSRDACRSRRRVLTSVRVTRCSSQCQARGFRDPHACGGCFGAPGVGLARPLGSSSWRGGPKSTTRSGFTLVRSPRSWGWHLAHRFGVEVHWRVPALVGVARGCCRWAGSRRAGPHGGGGGSMPSMIWVLPEPGSSRSWGCFPERRRYVPSPHAVFTLVEVVHLPRTC
jgi:hypothetical protein